MNWRIAGLSAMLIAGVLSSPCRVKADEPIKKDANDKYFDKIVQLYAADVKDAGKPEAKPGTGWITLVLKEGETSPAGDTWIGAEVNLPGDELRKKLELPKDEGVVVLQVVPDSPAAKAGLKVGDVILSAGDRTLKELTDALAAVRDAKDGKLPLVILRDGKKQQITVSPVKRPGDFPVPTVMPPKAGSGEAPGQKVEERRAIVRFYEKAAGAPDVEKIRAELRAVREQLANVDRQLSELEAKNKPDRERISRQMSALKRAINELNEAGRTEDVERLKRELRELDQQSRGAGEQGIEVPLRGTLDLKAIRVPGTEAVNPSALVVRRLDASEPVEVVREPVRTLMLESAPTNLASLKKEVEQLRRELNDLREEAARKEKH